MLLRTKDEGTWILMTTESPTGLDKDYKPLICLCQMLGRDEVSLLLNAESNTLQTTCVNEFCVTVERKIKRVHNQQFWGWTARSWKGLTDNTGRTEVKDGQGPKTFRGQTVNQTKRDKSVGQFNNRQWFSQHKILYHKKQEMKFYLRVKIFQKYIRGLRTMLYVNVH